jgi:hypothetical protein
MTKFTYEVRLRMARNGDLAGLLDMLRYDQARVVTWNHEGDTPFWTVELEMARPATEDRWASFAIGIKRTGIHVDTTSPRKGNQS